MQRKNPTIVLWTDLDHDLKLRKEQIEIGEESISVAARQGKITVALNDIGSAYVEEGLGIGKLIIRTRLGREIELVYFTKNLMPTFKRLSLALNEYKEKRQLNFVPSQEEQAKKIDRMGTLRWIGDELRPYKKALVIGVVLAVGAAGLSLVPAYMLKILIDSVLLVSSPPVGLFLELTIILVFAYAANTVLSLVQNYVLSNLGQRIVNDLRSKVYDRAMEFSSSMIDKITSGRIITRLTTDAGNMQWLMAFGFPTILVNMLTLIGIGTILFTMDWNLAIYVLIPTPVVIYALIKYRARSHNAYHKNWRRSADMINTLYDTVYSYIVVKSFAKERFEGIRLNDQLNKVYSSNKDIIKLNLSYWPAIGFLTSLSTVIIWWIGGKQVLGGIIQVGVITAFVAYMVLFYSPINQLSNIIPYVQQALTSGDRLREIIDREPDIKNIKAPKKPSMNRDIEFRNVWFGYDPFVPIIENFSMKLKAGHNIAVVGRSGSGKSTVAKLMMRFYEANRGAITIGKMQLRNIELNYLRDRVAYVPQDVALFDNSVAYNIGYGANREITPKEIIASARAARIHEEVMQLPMSYDTDLGERGWSLSGGQRQRLSVARAIIKKPDIVILDEATSNLDVESEQEIYSAILNLTKGKTTIFVTHNINEVMHSNKVIMMKKGKIVETGEPKALFGAKKEFHRMFSKQMDRWNPKIANPARHNPSIESYISDVVNDYRSVRISEGIRRSKVDVSTNGIRLKGLTPKLPFPITNVHFVMLYDAKGKAKLIIEDYSRLDKISRNTIEASIMLNTFKPTISRVLKIGIRGDELDWQVVVGESELTINTKGRRNVILYPERIVLSDVKDNIYEINLKELDRKSLHLLADTI